MMKTVSKVLAALKKKGNPLRVQAFAPHGAPEDIYGVSVADMKVIAKQIRGDHELACELYETGNANAMYLAGMVADGSKMNRRLLDSWAKKAPWQMVSERTVPGVACESRHARTLALKWSDSKKESVASTGWCTYSGIVATTPDTDLDFAEIGSLLRRVEQEIDSSANRVKYTMNGFVIVVGSHVTPLAKQAKATARKLGRIEVDMHGTTCKVPLAAEHIAKVEESGRAGKKRRSIKC